MKKTISLGLMLGAVILAGVLMGSQLTQTANAQTTSSPEPDNGPGDTTPDNSTTAGTLPPNVDPDSPLAQVIRLVQAGVEQNVILTFISNSTNLFNLNSEEIIYLNDLGAPPEIADAMMQHDQQLQQAGAVTTASEAPPPPPTEPPAPPPTETTVSYFYSTLAPYGGWVNVGGYGWCWRPTIVAYNNGWQPYCNNGHWVYSNCGWYWVSSYSWGWAPFHYGRWFHHPHYGWCWWPDTTWGPSWVCWRYNQNYCGWAPLPPHAVYQSGVGLVYQGHAVAASFNFGLSASSFTFVATKNFCDPHPQLYRVAPAGATTIYNQTTVINNISFDNHQRGIVNAGIPPQHITAVTHREIHPVAIQTGNGSRVWGGKHEQFAQNGTTLIVNRPQFVGSPVLTVHPGTPPGQNQFQPVVHGNGNYTAPYPSNPGRNNPPHQNINQTPYQNLNRTPPRVPQNQQPQTPYGAASTPQANKKASTTPPQYHQSWPVQNQAPDQHYHSDNRNQSPRQFGSEQPSQSGATYDPPPQNNTPSGQPASNPSANNQSSPSPRGSGNNNQSANHSGAAQQKAQSHGSSSSSGNQGQNQGQSQGNGQRGH